MPQLPLLSLGSDGSANFPPPAVSTNHFQSLLNKQNFHEIYLRAYIMFTIIINGTFLYFIMYVWFCFYDRYSYVQVK